MTLGKTSISLLTFFTVFDLDRLMAYPITSYDYDFNLDLNPWYAPMDEWLMRQISRVRNFTFFFMRLCKYEEPYPMCQAT